MQAASLGYCLAGFVRIWSDAQNCNLSAALRHVKRQERTTWPGVSIYDMGFLILGPSIIMIHRFMAVPFFEAPTKQLSSPFQDRTPLKLHVEARFCFGSLEPCFSIFQTSPTRFETASSGPRVASQLLSTYSSHLTDFAEVIITEETFQESS